MELSEGRDKAKTRAAPNPEAGEPTAETGRCDWSHVGHGLAVHGETETETQTYRQHLPNGAPMVQAKRLTLGWPSSDIIAHVAYYRSCSKSTCAIAQLVPFLPDQRSGQHDLLASNPRQKKKFVGNQLDRRPIVEHDQ